jgi:hypothetical protein
LSFGWKTGRLASTAWLTRPNASSKGCDTQHPFLLGFLRCWLLCGAGTTRTLSSRSNSF